MPRRFAALLLLLLWALPALTAEGVPAETPRQHKARLAHAQAMEEFQAGRYQQAARLFHQYLAVFPEDSQARRQLATARQRQKSQTQGTLRVLSRPPAQVQLDGRLRGQTPLTLTGVPVGSHFVQAEAAGVRRGREVQIKPMSTTTVEFDLTP